MEIDCWEMMVERLFLKIDPPQFYYSNLMTILKENSYGLLILSTKVKHYSQDSYIFWSFINLLFWGDFWFLLKERYQINSFINKGNQIYQFLIVSYNNKIWWLKKW